VVKPKDILEEARANPVGVRLSRFIKLVEAIGYRRKRQTGSHQLYERLGFPDVNLQSDRGMAKGYQVRQVLKTIKKHGIKL